MNQFLRHSFKAKTMPGISFYISRILGLFSVLISISKLLNASPLQATATPLGALNLRDQTFQWAAVGDSWAAGAAVTNKAMYDGDGKCLRNKEAWEALMAGDSTWTVQPQEFKFVACSGARLEAAWLGDPVNNQPIPQLDGAGSPVLLTMELGGNNCQFSKILRTCIYATSYSSNFPEPSDECLAKLDEVDLFISSPGTDGKTQSFHLTHQEALNGILSHPNIKDNPDFHLYIVGYAAFFNTSPDSDWCNEVSFGIIPTMKPNLTNALRSRMNNLVRALNQAIQKSVNDFGNPRVKFIDPDALFEGHRFCESGHTKQNQYFLNEVWFWNISPPEDDPDYLNIFDSVLLPIYQKNWVDNYAFPNGTIADEQTLISMLGSDVYSSGRTFHPKLGGHVAIKNAAIARLRADNLPGIAPAAPHPTPPKKQPYASGPIHIHVTEAWDCLDDSDNLSVEVTMWDISAQIAYLRRTQAGASASAKMVSKLELPLVITPEHGTNVYGYMQFQIGNLGFNSKDDTDTTKDTWCKSGGWDPRIGPECVDPDGIPIPNALAVCAFSQTSHCFSQKMLTS